MSRGRGGLGMAVLDGFLYAVGGTASIPSITPLDLCERYNVETNTWEQLPAMPKAAHQPTVLAHGGYLYVAGGYVEGGITTCVQRFDPHTRVWADMAPMQLARWASAGCVLDNKLYIIGGRSGGKVAMVEVECYDIQNNRWSSCSPMRFGRRGAGAAVLGDYIYVLGGRGNQDTMLSNVERYSPATDRWEDVPEMAMTRPREGFTCSVLQVPRSLLPSGKR